MSSSNRHSDFRLNESLRSSSDNPKAPAPYPWVSINTIVPTFPIASTAKSILVIIG